MCFTVDTTKGQTSNAQSATGWFSIRLIEQTFNANTLDVPSCRYTLQQAGDSSKILYSILSILPLSHTGKIIPVWKAP